MRTVFFSGPLTGCLNRSPPQNEKRKEQIKSASIEYFQYFNHSIFGKRKHEN